MMVALSRSGEVADFIDLDQFQWRNGKPLSQFMCGFTASMLCRSMSEAGKPPTMTPAQAFAEADQLYRQYDGSDAITNTSGMTLPQLHALLTQVGLKYVPLTASIATVKAWVQRGYPVIVAVPEVSVRDLALEDRNPYPWHAAGSHIIVITGVPSNGSLLVRDTANCTNLYDPNSLRPGPRTYDASVLHLITATAIVPPWPLSISSQEHPMSTSVPSQLTIQLAANYFTALSDEVWHCTIVDAKNPKHYDFDVSHGILAFYRTLDPTHAQGAYNGLSVCGLPCSPEIGVPGKQNVAYQRFERAVVVFDPQRQMDNPTGTVSACYLAHIDPLFDLQTQLAQLQAANTQLTSDKAALLAQFQQSTTSAATLKQQNAQLQASLAQLSADRAVLTQQLADAQQRSDPNVALYQQALTEIEVALAKVQGLQAQAQQQQGGQA